MKKVKKTSRKFIGFLVASTIIWFLTSLSKVYVTTLVLPVTYKELPQNKLFQTPPSKQIRLQIKATGFKIIKAKFKNKSIVLQTGNLKKKSTHAYYFLLSTQKISIQDQVLKEVEILGFLKDTVHLNLGSLTTKKVPLKTNFNINYQKGYDLLETIAVSPDSITVSGPETQINTIQFIEVKELTLNAVKANFYEKIAILKPTISKNIKINIDSVSVIGKVDKFTEGKFDVPYLVNNLPENTQLNTLHKKVTVAFVVALSNFNKIDENSFVISCDYAISEKNNLGYLLPKVISKPNLVKSVRIVPNKIDFLIQK